jgi:hypothetical protein
MEPGKFQRKTIHMPQDLQDIPDISKDINLLLDKNEAAIRGYISRYIYTSSISTETNNQLEEIFKRIRAKLY